MISKNQDDFLISQNRICDTKNLGLFCDIKKSFVISQIRFCGVTNSINKIVFVIPKIQGYFVISKNLL